MGNYRQAQEEKVISFQNVQQQWKIHAHKSNARHRFGRDFRLTLARASHFKHSMQAIANYCAEWYFGFSIFVWSISAVIMIIITPELLTIFGFLVNLLGAFGALFYHRRQFCIHSSDRTLSRTLPAHFRFLCHCKRDCDEWREPPMMANEEQSEQWLDDISVFSFLAGYV